MKKISRTKYYVLDMFPYISGEGLHVGHPKSYTATDIIARYKRLNGFEVFHPIGWDAFGLPTENQAIKTKTHPKKLTKQYIERFKKQIKALDFSYDWDTEIATCDPGYYKWTQWLFLKLYKAGLAYKKEAPVNWCESCKTVLANEQVVAGRCERCKNEVVQKNLPQWFFKITKYTDELLSDLDKLDWPEHIKEIQKNWIGKSIGAEIVFRIKNLELSIKTFTTRPDTLGGATFVVLAPEHKIIDNLKLKIENFKEVSNYIQKAKKKSELERVAATEKSKTGVELKGIKAINPLTNEELPIFVSDYILAGYGTGAVMCVPAHDERDYLFAKKYKLKINKVIQDKKDSPLPYSGGGKIINSGRLNGLVWPEDSQGIISRIPNARFQVQYKLRDWLVSRQRYWGAPIPIIYCDKCAKVKPKVLLVHGFEGSSQANWFLWTKKELEKNGFEVRVPDMPNSNHPKLDEWLGEIEKQTKDFGQNDILIGHSLGGWAVLKFLEQTNKTFKLSYLVAPATNIKRDWDWFRREWPNSDIDSLEKFVGNKLNFNKINQASGRLNLILSEDDPYIPAKQTKDFFVDQDKWDIQIFKDHGHFQKTEFEELVSEILENRPDLGIFPVPENELPVELPDDVDFKPTGESPLARSKSFHKVRCPKCNSPARRESDTMDTFVDSSWYFLRYTDPKNKKQPFDKLRAGKWLPVDLYIGGAEHAVMHLLYARFFIKALRDLKLVDFDEPFLKLRNQGLVLAEDGRKMSKSLGNVVNPDDIIKKYGSDTLKMYEMFMGPLEDAAPWDTKGIVGIKRFLDKIEKLAAKVKDGSSKSLENQFSRMIRSVTSDIESLKFNTAISSMMIFVNQMQKEKEPPKSIFRDFLVILYPFAPETAEKLWKKIEAKNDISQASWPKPGKIKKEKISTFVIQINGKVRAQIEMDADSDEKTVLEKALNHKNIERYTKDKKIKKTVFVPPKILNIVV